MQSLFLNPASVSTQGVRGPRGIFVLKVLFYILGCKWSYKINKISFSAILAAAKAIEGAFVNTQTTAGITIGFNRPLCILIGFNRPLCILIGFNRSICILIVFNRPLCILSGFNTPLCILIGFNRPLCILIGFNRPQCILI